MAISIPAKVVVFDYGEVISVTPTPEDRAALTELAGGDTAAFWPAYWRHRDALDQGTLSIQSYWRGIEQELGEKWGDATIHRLWLADFRSWLTIDHDTCLLAGSVAGLRRPTDALRLRLTGSIPQSSGELSVSAGPFCPGKPGSLATATRFAATPLRARPRLTTRP